MSSVKIYIPRLVWSFLQSSCTAAIASDCGMGYIAFCALNGNPLAFLAWGTLFGSRQYHDLFRNA